MDVFVKNRVRWPHEHVLSGSTKERVSYDQLTVTQWVSGFCRTIREEQSEIMRSHMLDYIISLMDDANDFSWGAAKASHAVLLCRMEQGEILDYSQTEKINRVRRANAQRHMPTGSGKHQNTDRKNGQKHSKTMICTYFNQNMCNFTKTHETKGVLYRHLCASCYATGKNFPYSEADCVKNSKRQKTTPDGCGGH